MANIYEAPKGVNKETGEAYGGQHRIQVMCENTLKNGEKRIELVDLSVDDSFIVDVRPFHDQDGGLHVTQFSGCNCVNPILG